MVFPFAVARSLLLLTHKDTFASASPVVLNNRDMATIPNYVLDFGMSDMIYLFLFYHADL